MQYPPALSSLQVVCLRAMRLGITIQDTLYSVDLETGLMGRRREALHRVAPGYNPSALLVPKSASTGTTTSTTYTQGMTNSAGMSGVTSGSSGNVGGTQTQTQAQTQSPASDPMDDLVSRLEEMESRR